MLKQGDIVFQDKTIVNNHSLKDNKINRMSVVLFTTEIDDLKYVCTCPIISNRKSIKKHPENYYYDPFLLLGTNKLCCVKVNTAKLYDLSTVRPAHITLSESHMEKIFTKIENIPEENIDSQLYNFIKQNIKIINREQRQKSKIKSFKKLN